MFKNFPNYLCCGGFLSYISSVCQLGGLSPHLKWLKLMASLPYFEHYFCFSSNCFQVLLNGNGWLFHFSI